MNTPVHIIRITYSHEWQCWLITNYDQNDDQIGESTDTYRLSSAIDWARDRRKVVPACRDAKIEVYYRDGGLRKTL